MPISTCRSAGRLNRRRLQDRRELVKIDPRRLASAYQHDVNQARLARPRLRRRDAVNAVGVIQYSVCFAAFARVRLSASLADAIIVRRDEKRFREPARLLRSRALVPAFELCAGFLRISNGSAARCLFVHPSLWTRRRSFPLRPRPSLLMAIRDLQSLDPRSSSTSDRPPTVRDICESSKSRPRSRPSSRRDIRRRDSRHQRPAAA